MIDRREERDWRARREDADRLWQAGQERETRKRKIIELSLLALSTFIIAAGIAVSAYFNIRAASIQDAVRMQINASKPAPMTPINE